MAKKQHNAEDSLQQDDLLQRRIQTLIKWLGLLVTLTLAKRFVAMILLSLEFSINRVMELTQLSDRTVYDIKRKMNKQTPEAIAVLLQIKSGRGRKGALTDVEDEIIAEVNSNNYVSHQHIADIADMIKEKFPPVRLGTLSGDRSHRSSPRDMSMHSEWHRLMFQPVA